MTWIPTHCDPVQPVANQLRVPAVPGFGSYSDPGSPRRGVIVGFGGLSTHSFDRLTSPNVTLTRPVTTAQTGADLDYGYLPGYGGSLAANLANDGWISVNAAYPELGFNSPGSPPNVPGLGLVADVASDPAFGARYLGTFQRWCDHLIEWIEAVWGPSVPIVSYGGSHGGWASLQFIAYAASRLAGGVAFIPATVWMNASQVWTTPCNFNPIDTSGMDIAATLLNNIPTSLPVLIGFGTQDTALGFSGSTVAAGSNNINVNTFTGSGVLDVADSTRFTVGGGTQWGTGASIYGPCVKVTASSGYAVIMFTAASGNQLAGCTTVQGSGTLTTGNAVLQNNVSNLISTALGAGRNITGNATADEHTVGMLSAGQYFPLAGPTSLSALSTLTLNDTVDGPNFTSGQTAVYASDDDWHTVSFTGTGTTTVGGVTAGTLTGCTYSGNTSATLSLGASICATGNPQSHLYFFSQNIDPNCPADF
jgi:hypothetical protein